MNYLLKYAKKSYFIHAVSDFEGKHVIFESSS